jgi:hypothetical protein
MKNYACIFSCMIVVQLVGMDTIEKATKQLSLGSGLSLSYDQLIVDNARHLKYLVEKEQRNGCCIELNKSIMVLRENEQKTYQDGYLLSRCDVDSSRLIVRLTMRPHDCGQLNDALEKGSLENIKFMCGQNPCLINAYSLYPDYGCVASPLHYMLWTCGKNLKWKDVDAAITYLLDSGANPNGVDGEGNTPLHKARLLEHMILLLARGACIDAKNNDGLTPLMEYVCNEKQELALFLIQKRGADIWLKDNNKNTLLHHAVKARMLDIIRLILPAKLCALSDCNIFGETPAQLIGGSNNEVKKLVQKYMIAYMQIALDKQMHDIIQYIIEQCSWVDYASIFKIAAEINTLEELEKAKLLKFYLTGQKSLAFCKK